MQRALFWTVALVAFPAIGLLITFLSGSFAALLVAPALLTFFAGYAFRRRTLEVTTGMVFSAIAGFGALVLWIVVAIVFFGAKPFE